MELGRQHADIMHQGLATETLQACSAEPLPQQDVAEEAVDILADPGAHTTQVELHISCNDMKNADGLLGKSDPFAVVYESVAERWIERGRTEIIVNHLSPDFVESVVLDYDFEKKQTIAVRVFDCDEGVSSASGLDLRKQTYMGAIEFLLSEAVSAGARSVTRELGGPRTTGTCTVTVQELADFKKDVTFTIQAHDLTSPGRAKLTKNDPYVRILKPTKGDGDRIAWVPVFTSAVKHSERSPCWERMSVALGRLCAGDVYLSLMWQVRDWEKRGGHLEIGCARASVDEVLKLAASGDRLKLHRLRDKDGEGVRPRGELEFKDVTVQEVHSFVDYVYGGLNIDFTVAVDFTASNGDPLQPGSLHAGGETPYEAAIRGVGSILDFYNLDKTYTGYAFGCKVAGGDTSHCYPLNGNPSDPRIHGLEGIIKAYRSLLASGCELSGPTNFAPVIDAASARAKRGTPGTTYTYLLILTDGEISDMDDTTEAIVHAAHLPLSILVVGIGKASFASAASLDCDAGFLRARNGDIVTRDVVQFVAFRNVQDDGAALARAVLAELPGQLLMYMRKHRLKPGIVGKGHATLEPTVK